MRAALFRWVRFVDGNPPYLRKIQYDGSWL